MPDSPAIARTLPNPGGLRAEPRRTVAIRLGESLRRGVDRLIARSSLVPNDPVLDMRAFPWTAALRANWRAIRDEAARVAAIAPDRRATARCAMSRSFGLWRDGSPVEDNLARCPATRALIEAIPGLDSAVFAILAAGAHIPAHRGVTKGLLTCHLGLIVPRDGDARMRVGDRVVRWAEGETLVFDDTYDHQVWNETGGTRVVLLIRVGRPLRNPGRWIADMVLNLVRRSHRDADERDDLPSDRRNGGDGRRREPQRFATGA